MSGYDHPLFFEPRFCGPPGVADGGFACGATAARVDGAALATARTPWITVPHPAQRQTAGAAS